MSQFTKHILTLTSGTAAASVLTLALTPVLTRIYVPEVFGRGEMINLAAAVVSVFLSFRLESAFVLVKEKEEAGKLFNSLWTLSLLSTIFFTVLAVIIGWVTGQWIVLIVPFSAFSILLYEASIWFLNSLSSYSTMAKAKVSYALLVNAMKIALGLLWRDERGIVIGAFCGQLLTGAALFFFIRRTYGFRPRFQFANLRSDLRRYSVFPKKNLPIVMLNLTRDIGLNAVVLKFLGPTVLGHVVLAGKLLRAPVNLLGNSVSNIIYQKLSENRSDERAVYSYFIKMSAVVGVLFIVGGVLTPYLLPPLFGSHWIEASTYVQILAPVFFLFFVFSTIEKVTIVTDQQGVVLAINALTELFSLIVLVVCARTLSPSSAIIMYVLSWVVPKSAFLVYFAIDRIRAGRRLRFQGSTL